MSEASLARAADKAQRRVEAWLHLDPSYGPVDATAYRGMVNSLVEAMNAVGPADAMTGITALTKTLALMLATTLRLQDDAEIAELCAGQGIWLENEVMALRKAMSPTKKGH